MIRIPALVQSLSKYVPAQLHPTADQYPGQLPELDIRQTILSELEAASVTHSDDTWWPRFDLGFQEVNQTLKTVLFGLPFQALPLSEAVREDDGAIAQEVEDVAEEHAVAVQKHSVIEAKILNLQLVLAY